MHKKEMLQRWLTPAVFIFVNAEVLSHILRSMLGEAPPEQVVIVTVLLTLQGAAVIAAVALRHQKLGLAGVIGFGGSALIELAAALARVGSPMLVSGFCMLIVPYLLGKRGTFRQVISGTVSMAAAVIMSVFVGGSGTQNVADLVGGSAVLALCYAAGVVARFRQTAQDHLLVSLQSQERESLARDLHDTVAHRVSAMLVQAQAGQALLARGHNQELTKTLESIEHEGNQALAEMRQVVSTLRASLGNNRWNVVTLADRSGSPQVQVSQTGDVAAWPGIVQEVVYRVAQEAVTNARRHATGAALITVSLESTSTALVLRVNDDGTTAGDLPLNPDAGFGIPGMQERAAIVAGTIAAGPKLGGGWQIELKVPRGVR